MRLTQDGPTKVLEFTDEIAGQAVSSSGSGVPGQGSSPNSTNTQSNCSSYGDMNGDAETDTVEKPLSIRLSGVAVSLIDAHPRELLYLAIQVKCLE